VADTPEPRLEPEPVRVRVRVPVWTTGGEPPPKRGPDTSAPIHLHHWCQTARFRRLAGSIVGPPGTALAMVRGLSGAVSSQVTMPMISRNLLLVPTGAMRRPEDPIEYAALTVGNAVLAAQRGTWGLDWEPFAIVPETPEKGSADE
jgi:hypothetical protein